MCSVPVDQWLSPYMDPCLAIHPVSRVANIGPSAAVRRVCEFKWMVTRSSYSDSIRPLYYVHVSFLFPYFVFIDNIYPTTVNWHSRKLAYGGVHLTYIGVIYSLVNVNSVVKAMRVWRFCSVSEIQIHMNSTRCATESDRAFPATTQWGWNGPLASARTDLLYGVLKWRFSVLWSRAQRKERNISLPRRLAELCRRYSDVAIHSNDNWKRMRGQ